MYFLFTDETNTTANDSAGVKFFVYGGLIIPIDNFFKLDQEIKAIRKKYEFKEDDEFKFDSRSRPGNVSREDFSKAKNEVIELCIKLECRFIAYIVLHEISKNQPLSQNILWGADHVIGKFNHFLSTKDENGYVMIDRLPNKDEFKFLAEKFCFGLKLEGKIVELDRISLFGSTCNNASNASSAMDIILGSFRYCINQPSNLTVASEMMEKITKLIWADKIKESGNIDPFEKGLIFRPKDVKKVEYKAEYDKLLKHINSLLEDQNSAAPF
ncbi:MAG TPA: DUF3800 domain-containing protein [Candidatus Moranbacteria bacterium]|nr:DUF3800 domain-containing protein [Candidatus Moranbacteria bacterium]